MARALHLLKTSFTSGELDPELVARNDIKHYYNGAETMADVTPKAQGGFIRRPGLEMIAEVTADIVGDAWFWADFVFDPDTTYGLLFLDNIIHVFRNRALVHTITGTPWGQAEILNGLSFIQDADTMLVFCNLVRPYSIVRFDDITWTVAAISFTAIPQYDYVPTVFEDAWSDVRGWPTHGCFHQSRLVLAGGPRLAAWGSRVGLFYDFTLGSGLDADAWEITINAGGKVVNIASLKDLVIFTTGGEFVDTHKPATPGNVAPESVTKIGSEPGIVLVDLEGEAIFVQKSGQSLRQFYYDNDKQNYVGDDLTLLASHLIDRPVSLARRRRTSTTESDQLLIVNEDGTARRCNLIMNQDVIAWSRINSEGATFHLTGIDDDDVYFLVEREIDGVPRFFMESFNDENYLDCSVRVESGMPTDALVAAHLPNTEVSVMADDVDMGEYELDGSGEATLERDAEEFYEIGLNFVPEVVTMPVEPELPEGTRLGKKKRISEVTLQLKDTNGISINGRVVPFRRFGSMLLDQAIPVFTGRKRMKGFKGWSLQAQVTLTQPRPGKMHVLALSVKVSV